MPIIKLCVLIVFPILSYFFISHNFDLLGRKVMNGMFGTLYTDMTIKFSARHTIAILCGRRAILVLSTVLLNFFFTSNFVIYVYGSTILIMYYLHIRPFERRYAYWLELFNESFIVITGYFCLLFTDWFKDVQTKYQTGNLYIDLVFWVIVINQLGIIYEIYTCMRYDRRKAIYELAWKRHYQGKT